MLVNFDSLKTVMNGIKTYIDGSTIKDWNENNPNSIKYIKNKPFYNYTSNKDLLSFQFDKFYPAYVVFALDCQLNEMREEYADDPEYNFQDTIYEFNKEYRLQMGSAENEYIEGFYLVEVTEEESSDPSSTWYDSEPGFYLESLENNINNTRLVIEIGEENYNPDGYYLYCFDQEIGELLQSAINGYKQFAIGDFSAEDEFSFYKGIGSAEVAYTDNGSLETTNIINNDNNIFNIFYNEDFDNYHVDSLNLKNKNIKIKFNNKIFTPDTTDNGSYFPLYDENEMYYGVCEFYMEPIEEDNWVIRCGLYDIQDNNLENKIYSFTMYEEQHFSKKLDASNLNPVDWDSKNTTTGEFIKNKPFGEIYEDPISYTTGLYVEANNWEPYDFYGYFGDKYLDDPISISPNLNTTVKVLFNDKEYDLFPEVADVTLYNSENGTTAEYGECIYLGTYPTSSYKQNYPFSIILPKIYDGSTMLVKYWANIEEEEKWIDIKFTIQNCYEKKIDKKYLPTQIKANWDTRDNTSVSYIVNKPFGKYEVSSDYLEYKYLSSYNYNGSFPNDNGTPIYEYKYYYSDWNNEISLNPKVDYTFYFTYEDKKYTAAWKYDETGGYYLGNDPQDFFMGNYSEDFPFFMYPDEDDNRYLIIYSYNLLHDLDSGDGPRVELYRNNLEIQTISQDYLPYKIEVVTELPDILNNDTFYVIPEETD